MRNLSLSGLLQVIVFCVGAAVSACGVQRDDFFGDVPGVDSVGGNGAGGRGGVSARGGSDGRGSAAGRGGTGGDSGLGGSAPDAGVGGKSTLTDAAAPDAGEPFGAECVIASDCDDGRPCTVETCDRGLCERVPLAVGTVCGGAVDDGCSEPSTCDAAGECLEHPAPQGRVCEMPGGNACTAPGACDGAGVCAAGPAPDGTACAGGSCALGRCIMGQPVGCPAITVDSVPFDGEWSSVDRPDLYDGSCDAANTPDFAFVFVAPQAGMYRFGAEGSDPVLTLVRGSCAGNGAQQLACNDDIQLNQNLASRVEVSLTAGQTVTGYVNEIRAARGGSGTFSISLR
jgi:hypothetical protein